MHESTADKLLLSKPYRFLRMFLAFTLAAGLIQAFALQEDKAIAATGSNFNPSNIISDQLFFDGGSMSAASIQDFLNGKVSNCRSGYVCLKDYRQSTPTIASNRYCAAYAGSQNGESAAQIIFKVGNSCGISPKVLLVLLEKEQSLVSDTWPLNSQYTHATGFSCPDTAPCDPSFSGFFYQVYYAARQFKVYSATPQSWNYKAGQYNTVRYHPNVNCGNSNIFIENQATAGLYIYTPYQPNAAALSNLYGTGDACSAYGNRNFWRIYTDWFGSTQASSLVRTVDNSTVFIISGNLKYPIGNLSDLSAYETLGQVTYVSSTYLNQFQQAQLASRIVRRSDGSIFLIDSGMKLPFANCQLVADYGGACDPAGYVQLTDSQASMFVTGPLVTQVMGTVEGPRFLVSQGGKKEILDTQSQLNAGISQGFEVLTLSVLQHLSFQLPITRDSVFVRSSANQKLFFLSGGKKYEVSGISIASAGLTAYFAGNLTQPSLDLIPDGGQQFTGLVTESGGDGTIWAISGAGKYQLPSNSATSGVVPVAQNFLSTLPTQNSIAAGTFIKSPNSGTVYVVMPNDIRPISSWETLLALLPPGSPISWQEVPNAVTQTLPKGPVALTAGNLYRDDGNATVYVINGVTNKIGFSSFVYAAEAGFGEFSYTNTQRINAYPTANELLTWGIRCANQNYVSARGKVHLVSPDLLNLYPFHFISADQFTCQRLKIGTDASSFIRTPDGTVFKLENGTKRPISSLARLIELTNGQSWLDVHPWFADAIPSGPSI
ncbi:hypothetical protein M2114_001206 [Aurantimicrobium minutum]|uniref:hypothetical protein n=1 Tax=Aurantimicrobium minutum TaxID=708131 RepID=UPI0024759297|nr:hypothetical protein [Aurantimicrobium minutum]MDH6425089.1 hypothetical protein [Aurantimicrobium minutum]